MGTILGIAGLTAFTTGLATFFAALLLGMNSKHGHDFSVMPKLFLAVAASTFIIAFCGFYGFTNALTGTLGGALACVMYGLLGAIMGTCITLVWEGEDAAVGFAIPALLVGVLLVTYVTYPLGFWMGGTAHDLAHIVHVVHHSASESIPQTDEKHLVLVTPDIAYNLAQASIGNDGRNLGSSYQTNQDEFTLQSIRGHLYYIAPLDYRNLFIQIGTYETPGYVRVDAEDPYAKPVFVTDKPLHYTTDAQFGTNLQRHVYENGYTGCNLLDPTLEVDDSDVPWYTVTCATTQNGFNGDIIQSVLLVNSDTGEIHQYSPDNVPTWVDRIYPEQTVTDYMNWWGSYLTGPGFNPSGQGQSIVAGSDQHNSSLQILYSKASEEPVYVVPMTSSNSNDNSSNGIALCKTRSNQCDLYPLYGYGVDSAVNAAFDAAPLPGVTANGSRPHHSTPQLVNLYGRLSWVTTYQTDAENGQNFWGIGIVDATPGRLSAANVVVKSTPADALSAYQDYIATAPSNGQTTAQGNIKTLTATILAAQSIVQNGKSSYAFLLKGDMHVYYADSAISRFLPFMQAGDTVTITYNDTGLDTLVIKTILDQRLAALVKE